MTRLNDIPGICEGSLQLLEAAGIGSAEELAAQDTDHLVAEMKRANGILSISKRAPGKAAVMKWIAGAIELVGEESETEEAAPEVPRLEMAPPVNQEANSEVLEMLSRAPCAIPLPGKIMMEKGRRVTDVPAGLLLAQYSLDPSSQKPDLPTRRQTGNGEPVSRQAARQHFETISVKPVIPSENGGKRMPASKSGHEDDRIALIRAPREQTNRGKDPESRRYIRGVLHTHPWSLRLGAVFTLLLALNLPLAIVSAFLLLASREYPEKFPWVAEWILAFPLVLPLIGLGYLCWGVSGRCRICAQRLFIHKDALKHIKAHRIPGMGFVIPLCFHLLSFHWFRCSSCGTPVRLKK